MNEISKTIIVHFALQAPAPGNNKVRVARSNSIQVCKSIGNVCSAVLCFDIEHVA